MSNTPSELNSFTAFSFEPLVLSSSARAAPGAGAGSYGGGGGGGGGVRGGGSGVDSGRFTRGAAHSRGAGQPGSPDGPRGARASSGSGAAAAAGDTGDGNGGVGEGFVDSASGAHIKLGDFLRHVERDREQRDTATRRPASAHNALPSRRLNLDVQHERDARKGATAAAAHPRARTSFPSGGGSHVRQQVASARAGGGGGSGGGGLRPSSARPASPGVGRVSEGGGGRGRGGGGGGGGDCGGRGGDRGGDGGRVGGGGSHGGGGGGGGGGGEGAFLARRPHSGAPQRPTTADLYRQQRPATAGEWVRTLSARGARDRGGGGGVGGGGVGSGRYCSLPHQDAL